MKAKRHSSRTAETPKGERKNWRLAYALALLLPLVGIVVSESLGGSAIDGYLAVLGIKYACMVGLASFFAFLGLLWLLSYIGIKYL